MNRFLLCTLLLIGSPGLISSANPPMPSYIAHAGGSVKGLTYTNSLEAIQENVEKGHRFFELDFHWTADHQLVLIHDWNEQYGHLFFENLGWFDQLTNSWIYFRYRFWNGLERPDKATFLQLKMRSGLHPLDPIGLSSWLQRNPDTTIITDIKSQNIAGLKELKHLVSTATQRFIPQIYQFNEYNVVRDLGFNRIILTLYQLQASDEELLHFIKSNDLWAVTLPAEQAIRTNIAQKLRKNGVVVYAHTVNRQEVVERLHQRGVYGFYTDDLLPDAPK